MILDQAFRYITELKKQNDTMLLEGGDKVQGKVYTSYLVSDFSHISISVEDVIIHYVCV